MTFLHAVRDDQHVNDSKRMMMEDSLPRVSDFVYAQLRKLLPGVGGHSLGGILNLLIKVI